jgi:nitrogen-specific signal transduction histidine kinase
LHAKRSNASASVIGSGSRRLSPRLRLTGLYGACLGPELPEPMIYEIFEPFRRMDDERTTTATGVGLGLSIVRAIADVHGGAIAVRSVEGGGLRVEVRF